MRAVDLHSRQLFEEHGLTGPQLATLREIAEAGRLSPAAIATRVHLSRPTVTGIAARLLKRGLVARTISAEDRRSVELSLTDLGRAVLARAPSLLQERFRRRLGTLEEWEHHLLLSTLQRIASMMDATELDAAPHLVTSELDAAGPEGALAAQSTAPSPDPTLTEMLRAGWSLAHADRSARDDA
jgi:DNA-binding MarR family transcriptional regulator